MNKKIFHSLTLQKVLVCLFILGLIYILIPGPEVIEDFTALPGSLKSDEPGDTREQNPNMAAYYSDHRRKFATQFYQKDFKEKFCTGSFFKVFNLFCYINPIRLNHFPEESFQYVRDQQQTTYLEEFVYPFRGSLFVNGYEPYDENGKAFWKKSFPIIIANTPYESKVNIRYYPAPLIWRISLYLGSWIIIYGILLLAVRRKEN